MSAHVNQINVVPVVPTFLQETGLSVFTPVASAEFTIQVCACIYMWVCVM